jgi:hypothetical protein
MARQFPLINWMMRREVYQRNDLPLGDEGWRGSLQPLQELARPPLRNAG